jgi:hypothetical protein
LAPTREYLFVCSESKQKAGDNSVGVAKEGPVVTKSAFADHNKTMKNKESNKCGETVINEAPDDSQSQIGAGVLAGITGNIEPIFHMNCFFGE